jgi:hypothetical protein
LSSIIVIAESTEVAFFINVGGCGYTDAATTKYLSYGSCSSDGRYYCDEGFIIPTFLPGRGCSKGEDTYESGTGSCCPDNEMCIEVDDSKYQCVGRSKVCSTYNNDKSECEDADCNWIEEELVCVASTEDYSCDIYDGNEEKCDADPYDVGNVGVGTDIEDTFECKDTLFVLDQGNGCVWDESTEKCSLNLSASQKFLTEGEESFTFSCSNSYELGECKEGKQDVTWTSTSSSNFDEDIPEECLEALNCEDGSSTRYCGEPAIKLPGFSLFSFFTSLTIIGFIYFLSENKHKKI